MRYVLTAPHCLQKQIGSKIESVLVEAGATVSDGEYVGFVPSPAMVPLDDESYRTQAAVVDRMRDTARTPGQFASDSVVPGFGPEAVLIGGDLYLGTQPQRARRTSNRERR